jgi:hypothetical protein
MIDVGEVVDKLLEEICGEFQDRRLEAPMSAFSTLEVSPDTLSQPQ